jgi:signal transduction histidine kinase
MELVRRTFSTSRALAEVQAVVKTLAIKKNISLQFQAAPDLPALFAEEAKFKQIMYNLLSNAIKFTPEGGRVLVTVAIQKEDGPDCGNAVDFLRVVVADTGIGIKAKDQVRIFKEFEQVDSSYGRQQQGTGLGLAVTKRLAEMHGGRITVESEGIEGNGSTFIFLIPILAGETG